MISSISFNRKTILQWSIVLVFVLFMATNVAFYVRSRRSKQSLLAFNSENEASEANNYLLSSFEPITCSKNNNTAAVVAASKKEQQLLRVLTRHSRMKIVIIDTDTTHDNVKRLIGSIHRHYTPEGAYDKNSAQESDENRSLVDDLRIVVYGLKLSKPFEHELLMWKNVEYLDFWDEMVKAHRLKQDAADTPSLEQNIWRPFVVLHALEKHEKILYLDSSLLLTGKLTQIERKLDDLGSYLVQDTTAAAAAGQAVLRAPQCSTQIQGYVINSYAHKHLLIPQTFCASRDCTKMTKGLLDPSNPVAPDQLAAITCQAYPSQSIRVQTAQDVSSGCAIHLREDLLFSASQLASKAGTGLKPENDTRTWIAFGVPSTSKGSNPGNLPADLPFFKVFLPSLLRTIRPSAQETLFLYKVFLVYDEGDAFYDTAQGQTVVQEEFKRITAGYPISLQTIKVARTFGWTTFLWNVAFQASMDEGFEYFYQANDDLQFINAGWSEEFVNLLKNNPLYPNLGMTGPTDVNNPRILTQAFTHRTHNDIFGHLYPPVFKNWFSDDFVSFVYDGVKSTFRGKAQVRNTNQKGTRYSNCVELQEQLLPYSLKVGDRIIRKWIESKKSSTEKA